MIQKGAGVEQTGSRSSQTGHDRATVAARPSYISRAVEGEVVTVPLLSVRPGESPRLNGEDKAHIARLAESDAALPPILVHRPTMRVIDGMHRLMAASLQSRETIEVVFFDGTEAEVFLRAVQENVTHGLPLTQADRRAAAERIIASHPHMSDRAIGESAGLAAKTVAAIRRCSSEHLPQANARVGRDGRVRPLDSGEGRRRAAELLTERPEASLRDVARSAGISPATVLDVRKRLQRGEPPVPAKVTANGRAGHGTPARVATAGRPVDAARIVPQQTANPAITVKKLLRDPSLRSNEQGRGMLRLLVSNAMGAEQLEQMADAVPPHCAGVIVQVARHYGKMWMDFARELDGRARIIDPSASVRLSLA